MPSVKTKNSISTLGGRGCYFLLCLLSMYDNAAKITSNNVNTSITLMASPPFCKTRGHTMFASFSFFPNYTRLVYHTYPPQSNCCSPPQATVLLYYSPHIHSTSQPSCFPISAAIFSQIVGSFFFSYMIQNGS